MALVAVGGSVGISRRGRAEGGQAATSWRWPFGGPESQLVVELGRPLPLALMATVENYALQLAGGGVLALATMVGDGGGCICFAGIPYHPRPFIGETETGKGREEA